MSASATAAAASSSPYVSRPSTRIDGGGNLITPANVLHDDALPDPMHQAARLGARQLLPWNRGRLLDAAGTQTLQAVGHPTLAQKESGKTAPLLFQPLEIRGRPFMKNRIVVSPMCMYSSDDGFLNDFHLVHLGQYALGGAGLIIIEATSVAFEGRISPVDSGLWKDAQIAPIKRIVEFARAQDTRIGIQLAHAGRKASTMPMAHLPRPAGSVAEAVPAELGGWPTEVIAPSAKKFAEDYWLPAEMSLERIALLKEQFISAARRAREAGVEYIEIHGAHGYLLTEFLSPSSNTRTDQYGGSFENRTRLLREIVAGVREVFPPEAGVLGVRLTCDEWIGEAGWTINDTTRLVGELAPLGVDLIDCSSGGNSSSQKIAVKPGYQVHFAQAVKQALKSHPTIVVGAVGLITDAEQAETILTAGDADVVLLAREFLRTPNWPQLAAARLGHDVEWAPQYQRAKPSASKGAPLASGQKS